MDRLHDVIQILFEWKDYHLYHFNSGNKFYIDWQEGDSSSDFEWLQKNQIPLISGKWRVEDLFEREDSVINYIYDFGDNWNHCIILEGKQLLPKSELYDTHKHILCLDGARAAHPEDVGSVTGYYEFCKSIKDRDHEEHKSNKRLYVGLYNGKKFKSEQFNIAEINDKLAKYMHWNRFRFIKYSFN